MTLPHELGFPLWVRLAHWFNFLFMVLLVRSGIEILAAHPKLYWTDHCLPIRAWLKFTRKTMPADRMWTSADEEVECPAWLGLPGGHNLGLGRYWHYAAALGWLVTGILYVVLMCASHQWLRLVPTSWQIIPEAWRSFTMYATFRLPEPPGSYNYDPDLPFNALQQLAYFTTIFILSPFMILTGLAMSPSLGARFPWYIRLFGGRQPARSLHFLGLVAFLGFFAVHMLMVVVHGIPTEMGKMVLGEEHGGHKLLATALGLGIIALVVLLNIAATRASLHWPRGVHNALSHVVDPIRNLAMHRSVSVQNWPEEWISPYFRANGYPPIAAYPEAQGDDDTYERLLASNFADYRLEIGGLVEQPVALSVAELRAMPKHEHVTLHTCIQVWTSIGKWGGVLVGDVLARCRLKPEAKFLAFHSFARHEKSGAPYYECIDIALANHPQTILAYELNGEPLPLQHGAPLRLRVETKLGFKMVKYLRSIEVVDDFRKVGEGQGGVREDHQQYDMGAHI
jgi:DMSO/TMAO reductase YedYZ molybdopterin-dependent catalytic subunit/thiosulfate reductase cytochrome b subunit